MQPSVVRRIAVQHGEAAVLAERRPCGGSRTNRPRLQSRARIAARLRRRPGGAHSARCRRDRNCCTRSASPACARPSQRSSAATQGRATWDGRCTPRWISPSAIRSSPTMPMTPPPDARSCDVARRSPDRRDSAQVRRAARHPVDVLHADGHAVPRMRAAASRMQHGVVDATHRDIHAHFRLSEPPRTWQCAPGKGRGVVSWYQRRVSSTMPGARLQEQLAPVRMGGQTVRAGQPRDRAPR